MNIVVRRAAAPHGRAYEGLSARGGHFRHPVFGNREVWVPQATRPYLFPAVQSMRPQIERQLEQVIDDVARKAGYS